MKSSSRSSFDVLCFVRLYGGVVEGGSQKGGLFFFGETSGWVFVLGPLLGNAGR